MTKGPRGWQPENIRHRFADVQPSPQSYNKSERSVDVCISKGSPVVRFYGTETLRISPDAVDLSRMQSGIIPLLDSHQQSGIDNALGRFKETWFANGGLMGKVLFNDTPRGRVAEGMVERGEIKGISVGYSVNEWAITDAKGRTVDPDKISFDDELTFEATRWTLLEGSLVSVPADQMSGIRSFGSGEDRPTLFISNADARAVGDCLARMRARQNMHDRLRGLQ